MAHLTRNSIIVAASERLFRIRLIPGHRDHVRFTRLPSPRSEAAFAEEVGYLRQWQVMLTNMQSTPEAGQPAARGV